MSVNVTDLAEFQPGQWPIQSIGGRDYLLVPEWFVINAVELAKEIQHRHTIKVAAESEILRTKYKQS